MTKKILSQAVQVALLASASLAFPVAAMAAPASQSGARVHASASTTMQQPAHSTDRTKQARQNKLATPARDGSFSTQAANTQAAKNNPAKLQTITVTATRRVELMKNVPISVTALSPRQLKRDNVRSATDLQYLVPNLTFSTNTPVANGGGFQIRGIGTQTYDTGVEQSVGLMVDGVVIGMARDPGITGFGDIAQIEVLRGPQGTLFGRNTTAGLIKVTTNNPVIGRFQANGTVEVGSRNERVARAMLNIPVSKNAAVRFAGYFNEQDGAIPYVYHPGRAIGDHRGSGIRGKFEWYVTDNLTALVELAQQKNFSRYGYTIQSLGTPSGPTDFPTILYRAQFGGKEPDPEKVYSDGDTYVNVRTRRASLKLDYALGGTTLTSITAWQRMQQTQPKGDLDVSPANMFDHNIAGMDSREVTQEFRITSPAGQRLGYVAGLYYYDADVSGLVAQYGNYYNWLYCGLGQPQCGHMPKVSIGNGYRHQRDDSTSEAAYGTLTWNFNDHWEARFGLRYTHDRETGKLWLVPFDFPDIVFTKIPPYSGEVSGSNVSGRASLQWKPNDEVMVYATYARGYKGPAIDGSQGIVTEVNPETVNDYEIGFKSTLFNGTMALNMTAYQEDFLDFQTQAIDLSHGTPVFKLTNAGHMRTRGIEMESRWRVTRGLTLSLNGAYNDAKYLEFIGSCYAGQPVTTEHGPGHCYEVTPGSGVDAANYAGAQLAGAPLWSYGFSAHFRHAVGGNLEFDASTHWSWRDSTYTITGDPHTKMAAYGILNLNIGLGARDGTWRVGLYARNLLDQRFYSIIPGGILNPGKGAYFRITRPDAFRTVGVSFSFKL